MGFDSDLAEGTKSGLEVLDYVFDGFFFFDVCLNFRIGYVQAMAVVVVVRHSVCLNVQAAHY